MKAVLLPIYFNNLQNDEFNLQLDILKKLLAEEVVFLEPAKLGDKVPAMADAVVFPVLVGEAFRLREEFKKIQVPIIVLTSEFGTVAMWDWEIVAFMKSEGLIVFAPYNLDKAKLVCSALSAGKELRQAKFLVFQDNPGEGMQASIFKRFYWWEDECTGLMKKKFGVSVEKMSFRMLAEDANKITDKEAEDVLRKWEHDVSGVSSRSLISSVKLYLALKNVICMDSTIKGVGINCLNESFYSDTTPCLAWDLLFHEYGILWACEADTVSLLTEFIIGKSLKAPVMMSNLYPFLMGEAALKHERIDAFPDIREPENCILMAHCGYMGLAPRSMTAQWALRPRVLRIVDENAIAVDARINVGPITLTKVHPCFERLSADEGLLEGYVQYPDSDCRNGAVIRVKDGHKLVGSLYSHHSCLVAGHRRNDIGLAAEVLGLSMDNSG